jgi:hypothetical protein
MNTDTKPTENVTRDARVTVLIKHYAKQSLDWLTEQMREVEKRVNREQKFIAANKARFENPSDIYDVKYKARADYDLAVWDALKIARDQKKSEALAS